MSSTVRTVLRCIPGKNIEMVNSVELSVSNNKLSIFRRSELLERVPAGRGKELHLSRQEHTAYCMRALLHEYYQLNQEHTAYCMCALLHEYYQLNQEHTANCMCAFLHAVTNY